MKRKQWRCSPFCYSRREKESKTMESLGLTGVLPTKSENMEKTLKLK